MAVDTDKVKEYYMQVKEYLNTLLIGEEMAKDVFVTSMLCDKNSRILLIGMPGTGKSTLSNGFAKNFESKKISVTSDLLPSDILNAVINKRDLQLLQLEELNRGSGKVQSSLIEFMADRRITLEGREVGFSNFYVIATQNDSEIAGIFDVPQAIYDRFDVCIKLGNLTFEELEIVLFDYVARCEKADFDLKNIINFISSEIEHFVYSKEDRRVFMEATKEIDGKKYSDKKLFGSSNIRGHYFIKKMALLHAFLSGRKFLMPDDISPYISNVYQHRINQFVLKNNIEQADKEMADIKKKILDIERQRS